MNRGLFSAAVALAGLGCLVAAPPPVVAATKPAITAIYPSGDRVPANHLKFYIHFSQPMRQGVFLNHCALLDEADKPVLEPFRETELWSEDRKRLTLWLHPGRQKTGVNLNEEFGPVLRPHRRYTLVISGKWPSEDGTPLGAAFRKTFLAIERATAQLDVSAWQLTAPATGSREPLDLRFPAPLDHALLLRSLRVVDASNIPVVGTIRTPNHEKGWSFTPENPWTDGPHRILADTILEDLAGNSLARPFEVDLQAPPPRPTAPIIEVPFRPATKAR